MINRTLVAFSLGVSQALNLTLCLGEPAYSQTAPQRQTIARTLQAAEAALRRGKPQLAAKLAGSVPTDGPMGSLSLAVRARALVASGHHRKAVDLLDGYDRIPAELLYLRGRARQQAGELEAGRGDLTRLWWDDPRGRWGLAALRELAETPGYYTRRERRAVRRTVRRGGVGAGTALLAQLAKKAPQQGRLRAELLRAGGIKLMHAERFVPATRLLGMALGRTRDAQLRRAITLSLAEAQRRRGHVRTAARLFDRVAAGHDDALAHAAHAAAGQMFIAERNYIETRRRFEAQLAANPIGPQRLGALRGLGWVAYRTGDFAAARQFFRSLVVEEPFGEYAAGARYWAARSLEAVSNDEQATRAELVALCEAFPVDYYTYRARRLLGRRPWPAAAQLHSPPTLGHRARRVEELLAAGMKGRVVDEVRATLRGEFTELGPGDLDRIAAGARRAGAPGLAASIAWRRHRRFPDGTRATIAPLVRQFPAQYVALIYREAKRQGVNPELAVSLGRQESALEPNAVSSAGALGLMQLMPATALEVAREFDPKANPSRDEILVPRTNVRFGVRYLKKMLRLFGHQTELALAAYNAGPNAVQRWLRRGNLPADIFVEEIPYNETRNYVRHVFAWRQALRVMDQVRRAPKKDVQAESSGETAVKGSKKS